MPGLTEKARNAYRRGGAKEVIDSGLDLLLSKNIPSYHRKKEYQCNKYIDELVESDFGHPITKPNLDQSKSSDTVFILGSGSSINEISEDEWRVIEEHDSMGLNRWPVHEFTPTYYIFEIPGLDHGPEMRRQYWDLLKFRKQDYEDTVKILKDIDRFYHTSSIEVVPDWLADDVLLSPDFPLPPLLGDSRGEFRTVLQYLDRADCFTQDDRIKSLFKKRGSISYTLFLATLIGYEKIVLCGVDMIDSKYFWDEQRDQLDADGVPIPEPNYDREREEVHRTNDQSRQGIPLEEVIYDINQEVLQLYGIELFTATKRSALYPEISYHDIGNQTGD